MPLLMSVLPLVAVMGTGYALRRVFTAAFIADVNRLLGMVFLPALIFRSTSRAALDELSMTSLTYTTAVFVLLAVAVLVAQVFRRTQRGAFIQSSFRGNLVYLGLPVVTAAAGEAALTTAAPIVAVALIVHIGLSIMLLRSMQPGRPQTNVLTALRSIVTHPLVLAAAAGLVFAASGVVMPQVIDDVLELLSRAALPLALIVVGWKLPLDTVRSRFVPALTATMLKLIVMPAVAWVVAAVLFEAEPQNVVVVVIMAGSPTAILAQTFAETFNADATLAAASVALSTVLSLVTLPVWAALVV